MSDQDPVLVGERIDFDAYSDHRAAEHRLNNAITHAQISESSEEYLKIFDDFYSENVEVSAEGQPEPIRGKSRVGSLLLNFLIPLHVLAEIAYLTVSIRQTAIPEDVDDETNSFWKLDLVGTSGRTCTLSWRTFRKWRGPRVVRDHHYDIERTGDPLTFENLRLDACEDFASPAKAS
jgi:hypothetical protein